MIEWLHDIPWYTYRLGALVLFLAAALYYRIANRRKSRLDYTICVAFLLTGLMLSTHPQAEQSHEAWTTGMWIAESICLGFGVTLAALSALPALRRKNRGRDGLPVMRLSGARRERVRVGAGGERSEEGAVSVALYPLRYRYSKSGVAEISWKRERGDEPKNPDDKTHEEIRMSWN